MGKSKRNKFRVNVGDKSTVYINWTDRSYNNSNESKNHVISLVSERYNIPKERIKVVFNPVDYNEKGEVVDMSTDIIQNIQDPNFQLKLFEDYIKMNNIEDVDFEFIKKIDSEINSLIDYDIYDKYRRYEIEWIEFDNFLSYGDNNKINFKQLNGLTLVSGVPGNMSGKTSVSNDLISFLLYGKPQKPYTLAECFNKFTNSPTFNVKGSLRIDGQQYIIERNVRRSKRRGTEEWGDASQKVKYYRVINGVEEELEDYNNKDTNLVGEHSGETNKIIKESIGNEKDFNMIISATEKDLDSLIDIGNTERGKLLSRWIGLLPLEEKDINAKEKFKIFERGLKSKLYNITDLETNNKDLLNLIDENNIKSKNSNKRKDELDKIITEEVNNRDKIVSLKQKIDSDVLKIDVVTVNSKLKKIEEEGKRKKLELETHKLEYETVKNINFSMDDYKKLLDSDKSHSIKIKEIKNEIGQLQKLNKELVESEYCPTCKRKHDNVDNHDIIKENQIKIDELIKKGVDEDHKLKEVEVFIKESEEQKVKFDQKLKLQNIIEIIPVQLKALRLDFIENKELLKKVDENKEAIKKNNELDIQLTNINAKINSYKIERDGQLRDIENYNRNVVEYKKQIDKNNVLIEAINGELKQIRDWKIYLEMVGKNGISKMVLAKTLPIINANLNRMLEDVADFEIKVLLTDKNEVIFKIVRDGEESNLAGASGFERTASGLALRHVLGNISTMPKPNFITLDEVLGKIDKEFYDNIKELYLKMEDSYQFILHITHIEDIKDWHRNFITINKVNNISTIK